MFFPLFVPVQPFTLTASYNSSLYMLLPFPRSGLRFQTALPAQHVRMRAAPPSLARAVWTDGCSSHCSPVGSCDIKHVFLHLIDATTIGCSPLGSVSRSPLRRSVRMSSRRSRPPAARLDCLELYTWSESWARKLSCVVSIVIKRLPQSPYASTNLLPNRRAVQWLSGSAGRKAQPEGVYGGGPYGLAGFTHRQAPAQCP